MWLKLPEATVSRLNSFLNKREELANQRMKNLEEDLARSNLNQEARADLDDQVIDGARALPMKYQPEFLGSYYWDTGMDEVEEKNGKVQQPSFNPNFNPRPRPMVPQPIGINTNPFR